MSDSLITRCPKCSTAFRVGADILSMAKGKVRCGQCFHIFEAKPLEDNKTHLKEEKTAEFNQISQAEVEQKNHPTKPIFSAADDDLPVSPEWLHTLFDDDDLSPIDKNNHEANLNVKSKIAIRKSNLDEGIESQEIELSAKNELAPWEREFAELESEHTTDEWQAHSLKHEKNDLSSEHQNISHSAPAQVYNESITRQSNVSSQSTKDVSDFKSYTEEAPEPDYMKALHSLAQSSNNKTSLHEKQNKHSTNQAKESLAPLINQEEVIANRPHTFAWFVGVLLLLGVLLFQVASHFFEHGSRSSQFRPFYKIFCTYTGCTLPNFEDISAISIQHVRIQSHPTQENALLVNAIMTNTSNYSQTMPKISLEFFDLNGAPVAARLFSPNDFLHKDFLDITYMPPNTPIHIVIPVYDPGAQAVTHKLEVYSSDTQSY